MVALSIAVLAKEILELRVVSLTGLVTLRVCLSGW